MMVLSAILVAFWFWCSCRVYYRIKYMELRQIAKRNQIIANIYTPNPVPAHRIIYWTKGDQAQTVLLSILPLFGWLYTYTEDDTPVL